MALHEVELAQCQDLLAIKRGLETEVVGAQRLDAGQACGLQGHLDAPALARGELLTEQGFNRLQCGELTALDTLHGVLQVFERAGHLQAHQMTANALERGTAGLLMCASRYAPSAGRPRRRS